MQEQELYAYPLYRVRAARNGDVPGLVALLCDRRGRAL